MKDRTQTYSEQEKAIKIKNSKPSIFQFCNKTQGPKIFIGGLCSSTTQEGIRNHFEQYGKLSDYVLMMDKTKSNSTII